MIIMHTCIHVGMDIVRKRFAILDISDNYSFRFASDVSDNDIYPGKKRFNFAFRT